MIPVPPGTELTAVLEGVAERGAVELGSLDAVAAGRNHLLDALAAAVPVDTGDAGRLARIRGLAERWTVRMALTAQDRPGAARPALVSDLCGEVVLVDRVDAATHVVAALDGASLTALLADALQAALPRGGSEASADGLLEDCALDPVAVSSDGWPHTVQAVLLAATSRLEAAYARRDEVRRELRPVVTLFGGPSGFLCLVARPALRSLELRHRDAGGAADLLTGLLLEPDGPAGRRQALAPAARLRVAHG